MTAPNPKNSAQRAPVILNMADVQPESVSWLWPGRIAIGKLTLLAGDPGLGKSFITMDIAARVSMGRPWPDCPDTPNTQGGVVLLGAEDDPADTIRPRLDAAGADASRVNLIQAISERATFDPDREFPPDPMEKTFDLSRDLSALESAIEQTPDCRLVVIDPITAYLGGTDSHKNAELRGLLAPLSELASRRGVAVLAVSHLNKAAGGQAAYRVMGSLAFTAAARAVWLVAKDRQDAERRLVVPVKNNLAGDTLGLAYSIESAADHGTPHVAWEPHPIAVSADDALGPHQDPDDDRADVAAWLRQTLGNGELPAVEVLAEAKANGFGEKATRKALKSLGGTQRREGFGAGGKSYWRLPA